MLWIVVTIAMLALIQPLLYAVRTLTMLSRQHAAQRAPDWMELASRDTNAALRGRAYQLTPGDTALSHTVPERIGGMIRVEQLMTHSLVRVDSRETVASAATVMRIHGVGSVFVASQDRIVGIVTEADIVRKVVSAHKPPDAIPVFSIMSSPLISIDKHAPLFEAADLMDRSHTRHLAVTDQLAIVGVLSVRDLLHPVAIDEF